MAKEQQYIQQLTDLGVYDPAFDGAIHVLCIQERELSRASSTGKRRGKRRSNGSYQGTNAEVAFILEYGSPRIGATHFMENTAEESEQEVYNAMDAELTQILRERGL